MTILLTSHYIVESLYLFPPFVPRCSISGCDTQLSQVSSSSFHGSPCTPSVAFCCQIHKWEQRDRIQTVTNDNNRLPNTHGCSSFKCRPASLKYKTKNLWPSISPALLLCVALWRVGKCFCMGVLNKSKWQFNLPKPVHCSHYCTWCKWDLSSSSNHPSKRQKLARS